MKDVSFNYVIQTINRWILNLSWVILGFILIVVTLDFGKVSELARFIILGGVIILFCYSFFSLFHDITKKEIKFYVMFFLGLVMVMFFSWLYSFLTSAYKAISIIILIGSIWSGIYARCETLIEADKLDVEKIQNCHFKLKLLNGFFTYIGMTAITTLSLIFINEDLANFCTKIIADEYKELAKHNIYFNLQMDDY